MIANSVKVSLTLPFSVMAIKIVSVHLWNFCGNLQQNSTQEVIQCAKIFILTLCIIKVYLMLRDIIDIAVSILIISKRPFCVHFNLDEFLNSTILILPLYLSCSMQDISLWFSIYLGWLYLVCIERMMKWHLFLSLNLFYITSIFFNREAIWWQKSDERVRKPSWLTKDVWQLRDWFSNGLRYWFPDHRTATDFYHNWICWGNWT